MPGTLTVDMPGRLPETTGLDASGSPDALPPPAGLEPAAFARAPGPVPAGPPVSGPYQGQGVGLNDPGGFCQSRIRIDNWVVSGNRVSFGAFNGTIAPDGSLTMQVGQSYIYGRFIGSHFAGRFSARQPSCAYSLMLDPAS